MSKRKTPGYEIDDEFIAQLDFLRHDHDNALQTIEQQKQDIQKLLALLIEWDVPIPGSIIDRYIKRASEMDPEKRKNFPSTDIYTKKVVELFGHPKNTKNLHTLLDKP